MARMHTTPRFPTGTRVLKHFPGYVDPFGGEIDAFLPDSGFYHIRYDDGDSEEMTEDDVERHYHGGPRKKERRPKIAVAPPPSPKRKLVTKQAKKTKTPRTKVLLLSGNAKKNKTRAIVDEDDEDGLADTEQEERGDDDDADGDAADGDEDEGDTEEAGVEQAEVPEVTTADSIYKLVGQRVCKRQSDGDGAIVSGTVLSYFPATKMYRVVYTNGTTDDMTYREVVDSIPLSATGAAAAAAKNHKRKPSADAVTEPGSAVARSQSPKKRKVSEKQQTKPTVSVVDENVNSENTTEAASDPPNESSDGAPRSVMEMPTVDESTFTWSRSTAYDTVRTVLYVVVSTTNETSEPLKVLEDKDFKPKVALRKFVERGGLAMLVERLDSWCKAKETEAGALAILKMLAVLPGVTSDAVLTSKIGKKLSDIRKKRGVAPLINPLVQELAAFVITKWKKELGMPDSKSQKKSKTTNDTKSQVARSSATSKSVKTINVKAETPSNGFGTSLKRSNSAGHLRELIGGQRKNAGRNGDLLGNSLSIGRPVSRPLGALHARSARRSTVLLDSIKNRIKSAESEKSSPTTGDRSALKADIWTASRVKFGGISTLEFDKEIEVSMLMIAPTPGAIRPFKAKDGPAKLPPPDKQPKKSILRVKLAAEERDANAAVLKAQESLLKQATATDEMRAGAVSSKDSSSSGVVPTRPSIGGPPQNSGGGDMDGAGDGDEEDGGESLTAAPPSPPRKHDASEDEDDAGDDETDLPHMPDDLVIGDVPSPPSDDAAVDEPPNMAEPTAMDSDPPNAEKENSMEEPIRFQRVASPVISSDSSSAESGEVDEDYEMPLAPVSPPPNSTRSSPSPSPSHEKDREMPSGESMDLDDTTATHDDAPPS